MKNLNNRGILLGVALLGASTLTIPFSAEAAPRNDVKAAKRDVKDARRDVRQERKDVRQADTPRERREAQRELRDAQRDLSRDKRDLRDERQERPGYRPGFNSRPGYGVRPGVSRTLEGTVINDLSGNDFTIRALNGSVVRVLVPSGEPGAISRGDIVRVAGNFSGNVFYARNLNIVRNR